MPDTETRRDVLVGISIPMPFGAFVPEDDDDDTVRRALAFRRRLKLDEMASAVGAVITGFGTNGQHLDIVFEFANHRSATVFALELQDARPDWHVVPPSKPTQEPEAI